MEWKEEGGSFGQGQKKTMRFGDFLKRLAAGEKNLYLSTQKVQHRYHACQSQHAMWLSKGD